MELWFILSVLTGTFFGVQSVLLKILSKYFEQTFVLKYLFLIAGILLLPAIFLSPTRVELRLFLMAFSISLVLNTVAYHLLLKAIAHYPVSIVMPYVGLTPLFLTMTSYLILGEALTKGKIVGIIFIVLGGFILQLPENLKEKGWRHLINWREKGIWMMVLVAFIWSITASVEKIAVNASSPEFYGAFIHLALGGVFVFWGKWQNRNSIKKPEALKITSGGKKYILLIGIVSAALAWCQLVAIKLTFVSYVIAFKRAGVLVSTLLAFFILKERHYLKALSGTILILTGAAFITL
ncbi:DMT family transporter [Caldithrix abyssi]|uniref:EamA domain-containing protein n=2 Tax=Caldithrix abyssi DSM 13497 TaxID=880073 RepID=H1XWU7_CALAY|nr:DMT family transporter [Caldithrix abyssi]EHO43073.1 protein of unknown function DUF6 transmembrane [Caldithrix abyssi DSM 13497]